MDRKLMLHNSLLQGQLIWNAWTAVLLFAMERQVTVQALAKVELKYRGDREWSLDHNDFFDAAESNAFEAAIETARLNISAGNHYSFVKGEAFEE